MYELHTEINIDASAARVWEVLTDFEAYPCWNPFVQQVKGDTSTGGRLEVQLLQPGSKAMTVRPKVIERKERRSFAWLGHLGVPKIFDGEHHYEIERIGAERVRFVHRERFGGILLPFLKKTLDTRTRKGFESMNEALKARAEGTSQSLC